jgi:hypothetical protein
MFVLVFLLLAAVAAPSQYAVCVPRVGGDTVIACCMDAPLGNSKVAVLLC